MESDIRYVNFPLHSTVDTDLTKSSKQVHSAQTSLQKFRVIARLLMAGVSIIEKQAALECEFMKECIQHHRCQQHCPLMRILQRVAA